MTDSDPDEGCASAAERLGVLLRQARRERGKGRWSLAWGGRQGRTQPGLAQPGGAGLRQGRQLPLAHRR